jgi:hypothetical protein
MLVKFTTCFGDDEVRTMSSKHLSSTASHRNYYSFCLSSYIPSLSAFRGCLNKWFTIADKLE